VCHRFLSAGHHTWTGAFLWSLYVYKKQRLRHCRCEPGSFSNLFCRREIRWCQQIMGQSLTMAACRILPKGMLGLTLTVIAGPAKADVRVKTCSQTDILTKFSKYDSQVKLWFHVFWLLRHLWTPDRVLIKVQVMVSYFNAAIILPPWSSRVVISEVDCDKWQASSEVSQSLIFLSHFRSNRVLGHADSIWHYSGMSTEGDKMLHKKHHRTVLIDREVISEFWGVITASKLPGKKQNELIEHRLDHSYTG